jgi:hypothetical protein
MLPKNIQSPNNEEANCFKAVRYGLQKLLSSYTCGGMTKVPDLWCRAIVDGWMPNEKLVCPESGRYPLPKGAYMPEAIASMSEEEIAEEAMGFLPYLEEDEETCNYLVAASRLHPEALIPNGLGHPFAGMEDAKNDSGYDCWKIIKNHFSPEALPAEKQRALANWFRQRYPLTAVTPPKEIFVPELAGMEDDFVFCYGGGKEGEEKKAAVYPLIEARLGWRWKVLCLHQDHDGCMYLPASAGFTARVSAEGTLEHSVRVFPSPSEADELEYYHDGGWKIAVGHYCLKKEGKILASHVLEKGAFQHELVELLCGAASIPCPDDFNTGNPEHFVFCWDDYEICIVPPYFAREEVQALLAATRHLRRPHSSPRWDKEEAGLSERCVLLAYWDNLSQGHEIYLDPITGILHHHGWWIDNYMEINRDEEWENLRSNDNTAFTVEPDRWFFCPEEQALMQCLSREQCEVYGGKNRYERFPFIYLASAS